jgi:hypothetical protein
LIFFCSAQAIEEGLKLPERGVKIALRCGKLAGKVVTVASVLGIGYMECKVLASADTPEAGGSI